MDWLERVRRFYALKGVDRMNTVKNRKESAAEHCWSCLMLADYFLGEISKKLDRLKVYELLLYHDLVEIEAGDIPIYHEEKRKQKKAEEQKALHKLKDEIPTELKAKFVSLFNEFEEGSSGEAVFARAIDRLDAMIHELDYKKDWEGWNESMLRKFYGEKVSVFPKLKEAFEQVLEYARKNGYFS